MLTQKNKWTMGDTLGSDEEIRFDFEVREKLEQQIKENLYLLKAIDAKRAASVIDTTQYQEYIKSKKWQETRRRILKRDHYVCAICGKAKNLVVHHTTYKNLGAENDADLITLCDSCHGIVHKHASGDPFSLLEMAEKVFLEWFSSGTTTEKEVSGLMLTSLEEIREKAKKYKEIL